MTIREKVARRRCLMDCVNKCDSADKCTSWKAWKDDTGKQIDAFLAAAAEEGWHMLPNVATGAMQEAGMGDDGPNWPEPSWRAMCKVAPSFDWG